MAGKSDIHIKLGTSHTRLIKLLTKKMGLDRSSLIKLALYKLAVEEGVVIDFVDDK
jgi:antitoxin component of RelBE/YafQ-DinJ toxin-antitoxin module